MKTKIFHIESYDDIASIKDKIDWGKGDRSILVFPGRDHKLNLALDLTLLKRHADFEQTEIAFVSKDWHVKGIAQRLGVPVFPSVRTARRSDWLVDLSKTHLPPGRPPREKSLAELSEDRKSPAVKAYSRGLRVLLFAIGFISSMLLLAAVLPSARIDVFPEETYQELARSILADPNRVQVDPTGIVPVRSLKITVEGRDSIPASGSLQIPQAAAQGWVEFTNLSNQEVILPIGTEVRTNQQIPIRFASLEEAILPAEAGSRVQVAVMAFNPGLSGNVSAETITVVSGDLGLKVLVNNPEVLTGGTEVVSTAPTAADYDKLEQKLSQSLWLSALQEAQAKLGSNDIVIDILNTEAEILQQQFSPEESQPSQDLNLQLQMSFDVLYIAASDLVNLAEIILDETLPEGSSPVANSLRIVSVSELLENEDQLFSFFLQGQRSIKNEVDILSIIEISKGKTTAQAEARILTARPQQQRPVITLRPTWWPIVPWIPLRIEVVVH